MASVFWSVDADGNWNQARDWSSGQKPGSGDDVTIDTTDHHTITFDSGSVTVNSLTVGNDDFAFSGGTLAISGGASFGGALTQANAVLSIGASNISVSGLYTANTGARLNGEGKVTLSGGASFSGSEEMKGSGTTVLHGTTTLNGNTLGLDGGWTLENAGTLEEIDSGAIYLGKNLFGNSAGSAFIRNDAGATIDFHNAYETNPITFAVLDYGGATEFDNAGLVESTGTGHTFISGNFINTGRVSVQAGILIVEQGGSSSANAISIASGATFETLDGNFVLNGGVTHGAGTFAVHGAQLATLTIGADATIKSTFVLEGNLSLGANDLTVLGQTDLEGSNTVSGTGTLLLAGGAIGSGLMTGSGRTVSQGSFTGGASLQNGYTFENQDTVDATQFRLENGTLQNNPRATLIFKNTDVHETAQWVYLSSGDTGTVLNNGLLETTGKGTGQIAGDLVNTGHVMVQQGELDVVTSMTGTGTVQVATGATFKLLASASSIANVVDVASGVGEVVLKGGTAGDSFVFNTKFSAADSVDGGSGNDTLTLDGDYASGLNLGNNNVANIDTLLLGAGHSYSFTFKANLLTAGETLAVNGLALKSGKTMSIDASVVSGAVKFLGGSGDDVLKGGSGNDTFYMTHGGNDAVSGGAGDDVFNFGATLTAADGIDGGTGNNRVLLSGNYSNGLQFSATTMINIENLRLGTGNSYSFTSNDATVAAGKILTVDGSALSASDHLTFDGSAETNGAFVLLGGAGSDSLTGGAGSDSYTGRGGSDTFRFLHPQFGHDVITDFSATGTGHDVIAFAHTVFGSFAGVMHNAVQDHANVVITLDAGDTLTLHNVSLGNLTSADFLFT